MGVTTSTTLANVNFSFPLKLEVDEALSKARFLKSHRCHDETGYFVVKTYVKPPGYVAVKDYKKELEGLKRNLTPHMAPYQYVVENEKTIQGVRQYFHASLSSRLSTLPFMTKIEKKWITYQLLVYLEKAEKWGLFHGDLKCENVMLTSWNWIFVTDHAFSYKPLYLPNQNYGGFSYFFDTSNRTCYMAPERFGGGQEGTSQSGSGSQGPSEEEYEAKLVSAKTKMDVFSMGCVIAELWLEQDRRLFEYGSILRFKEGSDEHLNILANIQDPLIRQLVQDMVHRDPDQRRSASAYLRQWTGTLFPHYFETLHDAIAKILTATPNERVRRISASLEDLHKLFTDSPWPSSAHQLISPMYQALSTGTAAGTPTNGGVATNSSNFAITSSTDSLNASSFLHSSFSSSSTEISPFVSDAPSPFANATNTSNLPFSKPALPSKNDLPAIKMALRPLLTPDALLELAVQIPALSPPTDIDTTIDTLQKMGYLDFDKMEPFLAICNASEALLPIATLFTKISKQDSFFELPIPKPTLSASSGPKRSSPVFQTERLPQGEMRFVDGQGGLMSATLASEALLRHLLQDQDTDSQLRNVDVNHYTSEEIKNMLLAHPLDLPGQPLESTLLAHAQSETHCRKLLEECFAALDAIASRDKAFPSDAPSETSLEASQTSQSTDQSVLLHSGASSQHPLNAERREVEQKMMVAFEMLSTLYRERGEFRQSLSFQQAFLGRAKHWRDNMSLLRGFQQYGLTCHSMGAFDEAISSYKQSLVFANQLKSKRALLDIYRLLSEAYADKSVLQTATYYRHLYEELQIELKGTLETDVRQASQNRSNSAIPRGTISVTPHKLLFSPTKSYSTSGSRYGSLSGSPMVLGSLPGGGSASFNASSRGVSTSFSAGGGVGGGGGVTPKKASEPNFSAAFNSTPSSKSEMTSSAADYVQNEEPDTLGYVIILDILCAMLPYLTDTSLKLTCLDCFVKVAKYADDEIRLQRLIPCLVSYLDSTRDPSPLVRAQTIKTLAHVITLINEFPIDDAHIFQDYLVPVLKFVLKEERESIVHQAFAEALPKLARSARLCLDHSQLHRHHHHRTTTAATMSTTPTGVSSEQASTAAAATSASTSKKDSVYEHDLRELRQVFHEILTEWLENAPVIVKRTVLEDIGTLAEFFGPEGTNNHLLQLIFSWLNFNEWELKCAVFDNIVGVSQVAGPDAIESYIESYLPIHDESEFVIDSAVNCLASLTEAGIFSAQRLREYTVQVAPLLLHPNAWIRFATVKFICKIAGRLTPVEVQCFIIPHLRKFLTHDITHLTQVTLLQAMHAPVSRSAFEKAMTGLNLSPQRPSAPSSPATSSAASLSATVVPDPSPRTSTDVPTNRRFHMLTQDSQTDFVVSEASAASSLSKSANASSLASTSSSLSSSTHAAANKADRTAGLDLNFSLGLAELDLEPHDEEKLFWMKEYVKEARRMRVDYKRSNLTTDSWAAEYTRLSREKTVHDTAQFTGAPQTPTSAVMPSLDTAGPEEPTELWKAMFGSSNTSGLKDISASDHTSTPGKSSAGGASSGTPGHGHGREISSAAAGTPLIDDEPKVKVSDTVTPVVLHGRSASVTGGDVSAGGLLNPLGSPTPVSAASGAAAPGFVATREPGSLNLGTIRAPKSGTSSLSSSANWVPQGILVATLSEHEEAVTQLQVTRDGAFFASGSHDGKVKIWDSQQFEHNGPLRSACTYAGMGSAITSISICQDSHSVAAASIQGSIHVFRIDAGSQGNTSQASASSSGANASTPVGANSVGQGQGSQSSVSHQKDSRGMSAHVVRRLEQNDGVILKLEHFDKGSDSMIVFATDRGDIRAWDLRSQKEPWSISNSPHLGLITSLMVDPHRNWLAVGTDAGNFTCWDIRFRVPLLHWSLPTIDGLSGIHALAADPTQNACFWASFGPGLVGHWNLESAQCRKVLRVAPRDLTSFRDSPSSRDLGSTRDLGSSVKDYSSSSSSTKTPSIDWDKILVPNDGAATSGDDFRIADLQKPLTESARSLEAHLNTIRAITIAPHGNFALTGGADKKLRFWNFDAPHKSCIISGKDPKEEISYTTWETASKHILGLEETRSPTRDSPLVSSTQQLPATGHCDTILDVKVLELHSKKVMAVSASRDGVIKVWK